jgi:hypothetical protein
MGCAWPLLTSSSQAGKERVGGSIRLRPGREAVHHPTRMPYEAHFREQVSCAGARRGRRAISVGCQFCGV